METQSFRVRRMAYVHYEVDDFIDIHLLIPTDYSRLQRIIMLKFVYNSSYGVQKWIR